MSVRCSVWGEKVTKAYPQKVVFEDASWEFRSRLTLLLAPNGSGKTTLLKLSLGLAKPQRGSAGTCVNRAKELSFLMNFGDPPGWVKVENFLRYILGLRGMKFSREEVTTAIKEVGLDVSYMGRKLGNLSTGELKRVLIASTIVGNPEVVIIDEPFSGLDPHGRLLISKIINEISRDKKVLVATHLVSMLKADEVYTIINRKVQGPLPPMERPKAIAIYDLKAGVIKRLSIEEIVSLNQPFVILDSV